MPDQSGFMLLESTTLFPGSLLPLFIFEPRYRLLLSKALDGERVFGVVGVDEESEEPFSVGGVGIIRACVQNPDGSSHLVLQGIERVCIKKWLQTEPYRIAKIQPLPSRTMQTCDAEPAMKQLISLCASLQDVGFGLPAGFQEHLSRVDDPGIFTDIIASSLIECPALRQQLLEETEVEARLQILCGSLGEILSGES